MKANLPCQFPTPRLAYYTRPPPKCQNLVESRKESPPRPEELTPAAIVPGLLVSDALRDVLPDGLIAHRISVTRGLIDCLNVRQQPLASAHRSVHGVASAASARQAVHAFAGQTQQLRCLMLLPVVLAAERPQLKVSPLVKTSPFKLSVPHLQMPP